MRKKIPVSSNLTRHIKNALRAGVFVFFPVFFFAGCWLCHQHVSPIPFNQSYALLQHTLDGGYYLTTSKTLKFKYSEEYNVNPSNNKLTYRVYDRLRSTTLGVDENSSPIIIGSPLETVMYGDNRYDIDFTGLGLISGKYYILEVINDKDEMRYLRFKLD